MPASKCVATTPRKCLTPSKHKALTTPKWKQVNDSLADVEVQRSAAAQAEAQAKAQAPAQAPAKRQRAQAQGGAAPSSKRQRLDSSNDAAEGPASEGMHPEPVIRMLRKVMNALHAAKGSAKQGSSSPTVAGAVAKALAASGSTRKVWDGARDVERRAKEAHRRAELVAQKLDACLSAKGSRMQDRRRISAAKASKQKPKASATASKSSSSALGVDAFKQRAKAVTAAKEAEAEAETSLKTLMRRKEALVTAQQDYVKPLLALEEGDEQAEELVLPLIKVLAESGLEIGGKWAGRQAALAQLLAWDPEHRCASGSASELKLWHHLDETLSKAEADLEEKISRAMQDRDARADAAAGAQALDKAWAEVKTLGAKVHVTHEASTDAAEKWFRDVQAGPVATYFWTRKGGTQELALVPAVVEKTSKRER